MKKIGITIFLSFVFLFPSYSIDKLDSLETIRGRLWKGDKKALYDLAPWLDRTDTITMFFHCRIDEQSISDMARATLEDYCFFTTQEFPISDTTSKHSFTKFLNKNFHQISFDTGAKAYLITPFEKRYARMECKELREEEKKLLSLDSIFKMKWVNYYGIDTLLRSKNPECLHRVAIAWFASRKIKSDFFYRVDVVNVLRSLTGVNLMIEYEPDDLLIVNESTQSDYIRQQLLISLSTNWNKFYWDKESGFFKNKDLVFNPLSEEEKRYVKLTSKIDSVALEAYIYLTEANPKSINQLERYLNGKDCSYALPIFEMKFLRQLCSMTEYCREHKINYKGPEGLKDDLKKFKEDLSFKDRVALEDKFINSLTLDQITAFEYWALIYENNFRLTYSTGRVIDRFYSIHWNKLLQSPEHLLLYLKKCAWYDRLGIIGICNTFKYKFDPTDTLSIGILKRISTSDKDVNEQIELILAQKQPPPQVSTVHDEYESNYFRKRKVPFLSFRLQLIRWFSFSEEMREERMNQIVAKIQYSQIRKVVRVPYEEYFIESDFGMVVPGDMTQKKDRKRFIRLHKKLSEEDFYRALLDSCGTDYRNLKKELDYDKIYELLKYDVVSAFVGGGGGKDDRETYMLIKLLELKFNTTLGFPNKLCNSEGMYYCSADSRAMAWMKFLKEKKIVQQDHNEPISIGSIDLD